MTIHSKRVVIDPVDRDNLRNERTNSERKALEARIKARAALEREEPGRNPNAVDARRNALLNLVRNGQWDRVYKQFLESKRRGGVADFWNEDAPE